MGEDGSEIGAIGIASLELDGQGERSLQGGLATIRTTVPTIRFRGTSVNGTGMRALMLDIQQAGRSAAVASSARRRHRFLPYRFEEQGLVARVARCVLDQRPAGIAADRERHLLDLSTQRFTRAEIELAVTVPPEVLRAVVPADEHARPPVQVLALVSCGASRSRRAVQLAAELHGAGAYSGTIAIERADVTGAVEVTAMLVRALDGADGAGWAARTGERLASSRTWEIRVDASQAPRGEYLDIRYEDFAKVGPPQFPVPAALYQLECESEAPILWLNTGSTRLANALSSDASIGRIARVRDATFDRIIAAVWARLFLRAMSNLGRTGEPTWPWQIAVLQQWLPRLYAGDPDHESRVESLRRELADGDADAVIARLDLAIQDEIESARVHEALVEELES